MNLQEQENMNEEIHRELDRLGAPRRQDNGFGYSPVGRLRRLITEEIAPLERAAQRYAVDCWRDKWVTAVIRVEKAEAINLGLFTTLDTMRQKLEIAEAELAVANKAIAEANRRLVTLLYGKEPDAYTKDHHALDTNLEAVEAMITRAINPGAAILRNFLRQWGPLVDSDEHIQGSDAVDALVQLVGAARGTFDWGAVKTASQPEEPWCRFCDPCEPTQPECGPCTGPREREEV